MLRGAALACLAAAAAGAAGAADDAWKFLGAYPAHYVAQRLSPAERISVDGRLDDPAWEAVPWSTDPFVDITLHNDSALNRVPAQFQAAIKVRWDAAFLYVGAKLQEPFLYGTVTGHNTGPKAPYADNDFEFFVDVSGTTQYYKEFEMNILNATYDVNWGVPDHADLRCDGSGGANASLAYLPVCVNTSFPDYAGSWTMKGGKGGMTTATAYRASDWATFRYPSSSWTLEIAFPLRGGDEHGGLLDAEKEDFSQYDPNRGPAAPGRPRYWRADFSRAEHPRRYNGSAAGPQGTYCPFDCTQSLGAAGVVPQLENPTQDECAQVLARWPTLLGVYPWNCYWEWVWQSLGAEAYMHRPMEWGVLQFAESGASATCRDVEHPARHVARMIYYAQAAHQQQRQGSFAGTLAELLSPELCAAPACSLSELRYVAQSDVFDVSVRVVEHAEKLTAQCTARPCYTASVTVTPPPAAAESGCSPPVTVTVNENMLVEASHRKQGLNCSRQCL